MAGHRHRALWIGVVAAFVLAGGTAWAVAQTDDSGPERPTEVRAPIGGQIAEGGTPSGGTYSVSRIDPAQFKADPAKWFCTEIATSISGTQGCHPVPDDDGRVDGEPLKPSFALLGTDRFFSLIAPKGVTTMEVRIAGDAKTIEARAIDVGLADKLLVAAVGGPTVTSSDPASSRDYEVRLVGPGGETVSQIAMSDPGR